MLTDFQRRKLARLFHLIDNDGSAFVDQTDLDRIAASLAERIGIQQGSEGHRVLIARYAELWAAAAGMDSDGDGRVTLDEWLAAMETIAGSEQEYDRVFGQMVDQLFDLLDADGDGRVTREELSHWLAANHVEESSAREAFPRLDLDGDGVLSKDEVTYLLLDYFYSDDPDAPGNWLFGAGV